MLKPQAFPVLILTCAITAFPITRTPLQSQEVPAARVERGAATREARALLVQARLAARRIKDNFQRDGLLGQIGFTQAKAGDLDAAVETENAMRFPSDRTLDEIGEQLAKASDLTRARVLGEKLKDGGLPGILVSLVEAQAKLGNIAGAMKSAEQISNPEIRGYALEKIATRLVIDGDDEGARKTLSLARETHPSSLLDADDLEMMILGRELSKLPASEARSRMSSLKSDDTKAFLMIGVADDLSKKGDRAAAKQWLEDAFKELPTGSQSDFTRYFVIPYQVKLGQKEAALVAAGALPPELRVKGYMAVAVTCAEIKDIACVEFAIDKMRLSVPDGRETGTSGFALKLMTLNVVSALIDNGQFREAGSLLNSLEEQGDDASYQLGIGARLQLQRILLLAREQQFAAARSLALKMRPNSMTDQQRGTAFRITALLETKQNGTSQTLRWSRALVDVEDRSYSMLGVAQALLEMDEVKLGYTAIMVH